MKRSALLLAAVSLLLVSAPLPAQGPGPNTLTKTEIEDGWTLLFDGDTNFGWAPRGSAKWVAAAGTLTPIPGTGAGVLTTTTEFGDFQLRADFWVDEAANSGVFLRCPPAGGVTALNAYEVNIYDRHARWPTGSINEVGRAISVPHTTGGWNSYDITANGGRLTVRLNEQVVLNVFDGRHARGGIGLQTNGDGEIRFRNVKLRPLGLKSVFNGKDLSGWKAIPDRKSVFSVTPEGWINVKNGNGDLQSSATYGDFVFQLGIISNGTHLNSGIFFRADAGQFWSGYEAQIRNQWVGEDRTNPVDFGTGALYNRQRARKVISSDREWFTMSIVAHGPHLATWVNGIQVADFMDTRPPNANARTGYRSQAGVLSIQGHDPTTDLSFRNLRIAELPPARK